MAHQLKTILSSVHLRKLSSPGFLQQNITAIVGPLAMQHMTFTDGSRSPDQRDGLTSASDDTYQSRVVQFSPSRSRDMMGRAIDIQHDNDSGESINGRDEAVTSNREIEESDRHVESYDTHGNLSLNSAMQTMVPEPFSTQGKNAPTHLNMPGGHISQGQKYLADDLRKTHYQSNTREMCTLARSSDGEGTSTPIDCRGPPTIRRSILHAPRGPYCRLATLPSHNHCFVVALGSTLQLIQRGNRIGPLTQIRSYANQNETKLTQRLRLKQAIKDYGATVVVFHVSISLVSLGGFYVAVSSGVDVSSLLAKLPLDESLLENKLAAGVSTFALAYAVHKVFAPVRIAITLASTPFIVRYLRKIGFLKPPKIP